MKKEKITKLFEKVMDFGKESSPEILTGLAVVGIVTTAVMAAKAGIKAKDILQKRKNNLEELKAENLPKEKEEKERKEINIETTKEMAVAVAPVVVMGGMTIACAIGSNRISARRVKVLSAAYALAEKGLKELTEKSQDILGEKKFTQITDAIKKEKLAADPPTLDNAPVIVSGTEDVLCKDLYTGRYFRSNAQKIGQAINALSADCASDMYVSLNDFYDLINSPELTSVPMGEEFGWNANDLVRGKLPITFTALLTPNTSVPCLCVDYMVFPREDFRNLH